MLVVTFAMGMLGVMASFVGNMADVLCKEKTWFAAGKSFLIVVLSFLFGCYIFVWRGILDDVLGVKYP
ncbi:MAG: hypothetical protein PHR50_14995 [Lachnospiraceae bacterium]|nr:hypothetical protein [Lachnospiraceae bacterium]